MGEEVEGTTNSYEAATGDPPLTYSHPSTTYTSTLPRSPPLPAPHLARTTPSHFHRRRATTGTLCSTGSTTSSPTPRRPTSVTTPPATSSCTRAGTHSMTRAPRTPRWTYVSRPRQCTGSRCAPSRSQTPFIPRAPRMPPPPRPLRSVACGSWLVARGLWLVFQCFKMRSTCRGCCGGCGGCIEMRDNSIGRMRRSGAERCQGGACQL